jgi:hypothetical protein
LCAYDARLSLAKRGFCPCDVFAGWKHGKAAPAARKAAGLPSVDAQRLVQHDVFNLVVLPVLMVLNIGSWLGLVSHYLYTVLFAAYIGADFLYIWAWPEAVPQPSLVLAHHSFVLALLSPPLRYPLNAHFPANVYAPPPPRCALPQLRRWPSGLRSCLCGLSPAHMCVYHAALRSSSTPS